MIVGRIQFLTDYWTESFYSLLYEPLQNGSLLHTACMYYTSWDEFFVCLYQLWRNSLFLFKLNLLWALQNRQVYFHYFKNPPVLEQPKSYSQSHSQLPMTRGKAVIGVFPSRPWKMEIRRWIKIFFTGAGSLSEFFFWKWVFNMSPLVYLPSVPKSSSLMIKQGLWIGVRLNWQYEEARKR